MSKKSRARAMKKAGTVSEVLLKAERAAVVREADAAVGQLNGVIAGARFVKNEGLRRSAESRREDILQRKKDYLRRLRQAYAAILGEVKAD